MRLIRLTRSLAQPLDFCNPCNIAPITRGTSQSQNGAKQMTHIKPVLNQLGIFMELHRENESPVTLNHINVRELEAYRDSLAESNPDYRHATIGQLAVMYANRIYGHVSDVVVTQCAWTYNASTEEYTRA